jgi:hypothetical protein
MIPPAAQRLMSKRAGATVVEVKGSHSIYVSQPEAVASLIEKAAKGVQLVSTYLILRTRPDRAQPNRDRVNFR